jgi:hypothetical protein
MPSKSRLTKRFRERKTIQTYTPTAANELAMPLTVTKMGKSVGFASGPRGRKVMFAVDPHDTKKVWLSSHGIEYGWTPNK